MYCIGRSLNGTMAESAPPESLLNFEAPLFVGENSKDSTKPVPESQGSASQGSCWRRWRTPKAQGTARRRSWPRGSG